MKKLAKSKKCNPKIDKKSTTLWNNKYDFRFKEGAKASRGFGQMEGLLVRDSLPSADISKDETESFDKESIFSYGDNFNI